LNIFDMRRRGDTTDPRGVCALPSIFAALDAVSSRNSRAASAKSTRSFSFEADEARERRGDGRLVGALRRLQRLPGAREELRGELGRRRVRRAEVVLAGLAQGRQDARQSVELLLLRRLRRAAVADEGRHVLADLRRRVAVARRALGDVLVGAPRRLDPF
jgi:hypothetical protein